MTKQSRIGALALLGLLGVLGLPTVGWGQDPVPLYPQNYRILFENEQVRVLDFRLAKGATERTHTHPANVAVFLNDLTIRFTLPDGQTRIRRARAGDVAYSDAIAHASENIGGTDAHGILVELKPPRRPAASGAQ